MIRAPAACLVLLCAVSALAMAADINLTDKIDEVKRQIASEEQVNIELKAQLAAREIVVTEGNIKLKQIDDRINALKKENHLESN